MNACNASAIWRRSVALNALQIAERFSFFSRETFETLARFMPWRARWKNPKPTVHSHSARMHFGGNCGGGMEIARAGNVGSDFGGISLLRGPNAACDVNSC